MPTVVDWRQGASIEELSRIAIDCLRNSQPIAIPTEIGYAIITPSSVTLSNELASLVKEQFECFFTPSDFIILQPELSDFERGFIRRVTPGPIAIVLDGSRKPIWFPSHPVASALLGSVQGSLHFYPLKDGTDLQKSSISGLFHTIISDSQPRTDALTHIRLKHKHWVIEKVGTIGRDEIQSRLTRKILFVCTGNTCRSPMAKAIFEHEVAKALKCTVAELPNRGISIKSAGVAAGPDEPVSPEAVEALRSWNIDLSGHRSTPTTADMIAKVDEIIAMTRNHLMMILHRYPIIGGSMRLLCGEDGDLSDPIGGDESVYRSCASAIKYHVDRLISEMGLS